MFVGRFLGHARELGHLVVGRDAAGADHNADVGGREVADEPLQDRENRVGVVADAEEDLVIGIVLAAEAGVILIGVGVESAHRFQIADGRKEAAGGAVFVRARRKNRKELNSARA